MEHQQDIFYDIEELPHTKLMELIDDAVSQSDNIDIDKIIGWQRQIQPDASPQEWFENIMKPDSMFRFVHRRGYSNPYHIQVVIREGSDFLWINLKERHLNYFVEKYNLGKL